MRKKTWLGEVKGAIPSRGAPGDRHPNKAYYERYDGAPLTVEYRQKYPPIAK